MKARAAKPVHRADIPTLSKVWIRTCVSCGTAAAPDSMFVWKSEPVVERICVKCYRAKQAPEPQAFVVGSGFDFQWKYAEKSMQEITKVTDPERLLFLAVIAQTLEDYQYPTRAGKYRVTKGYFDTEDFLEVCARAKVEPEMVVKKLEQIDARLAADEVVRKMDTRETKASSSPAGLAD